MHTYFLAVCLAALTFLPSASRSDDDKLWTDHRLASMPTTMQGPFVRTKTGEILAIDSASSYVSIDGGETWSDPRPLFPERTDFEVSRERTLLSTESGVIVAAFMNLRERNWTWNDELHDAPGARLPTYVMRSLDDGRTWQDIQKVHDEWTGANRDMIQTSTGRIIFTSMKMLNDPGRHTVLTYSSDDDGLTWKASNLVDLGGRGHHGGVTEPTLTELSDGRIWMLIRTNWGQFWSGYSFDDGQTWRVLQPSGIPASSAPGLIKRLSSGRLLLVWNRPEPESGASWPLRGGDGIWSDTPVSNHREELSIAFSEDEGETWSEPVVVARQSGTWLAYPYVFEVEPGLLWLTTMQGELRVQLQESDFADGVSE